ncbi:ATP synthase subunit e, mitochondrial [Aphelenchoides fujianensis]|nr:ATP synthase subunit e, mitochondrial [Aphelenchoides fujianensis]
MSRHPNAVVLPEPINVSPLIRFSRWTALGLGIVWGAYRLRQIKEYHADIRDWDHAKAVAAQQEAATKKKWAAKDEMRYLMKARSPSRFSSVVNLPFEEGVAQFGVEDLFREE